MRVDVVDGEVLAGAQLFEGAVRRVCAPRAAASRAVGWRSGALEARDSVPRAGSRGPVCVLEIPSPADRAILGAGRMRGGAGRGGTAAHPMKHIPEAVVRPLAGWVYVAVIDCGGKTVPRVLEAGADAVSCRGLTMGRRWPVIGVWRTCRGPVIGCGSGWRRLRRIRLCCCVTSC